MRILELSRYNIPEKIVDSWIGEMGEELLPVQERAIKRHRVLEGKSLIISSPTTSGKTFIGEIAAVKGVMEKKKVLYLVPLKSLAEEKYLDFHKKYESFGIRTVVSTRDHREYDRMIEAGEFGIAVIVYEKMAQLMVKNPFLLKNIALVIIDELQEIGDPDRGPGLEITLTKIVTSPYHPQIIGLSAVLGNTEALARWLDADLLSHDKRPVELHEGVLYNGVFHYRTHNTREKGSETLADVGLDDPGEILLANVAHLVKEGEQILVFIPSKMDTMAFADMLIGRIDLGRAQGAIEELAFLEETSLKGRLDHCLQKSVAFHHADLSREERDIIERYTRTGEIKVIFCTTTLAMGVNLPASTVFLHTQKWEADESDHMISTPIAWAEYENISGRAGRLGFGRDFGRSITIARNDYEYQMLWENYIDGEVGMLASQITRQGFEDHLVNIMASGLGKTREELESFLSRTFMGLSESVETLRKCMEKALQFLLDNNLIEQDRRGEMNVSTLGSVVATKGITCLTALDLASFLREVGDRELTDLEILHAVASSDDGKRIYIQIAQHEHRNRKYEGFVKEKFAGQQEYVGTLLSQVIKSPLLITKKKAKSLKLTLLLDRWIRGKETPSLEQDFQSYYGTIVAAAEGMSWIVDAASLVAQSIGSPKPLQDRLAILSERLLYGVEESSLELARLRIRGLGRAGISKLVKEGFNSRKAIQEAPVTILATLIPEKIVINLKQAVEPYGEVPVETRIGEPVETFLSDDTFFCHDRIEITGKQMEKRNLVMINGSPTGITNRSLELLLHFAVVLKKDGRGWVHKEDLTSDTGATQLISRLRNELRNLTLTKDGKIIENDGSGSYRLSIPPRNVVIDKEDLQKHWNAVIKELAKSI
jgi:helicase